MLPCGPLSVTSEKLEMPAEESVVAQTRPPGVSKGPSMGPSPLVVAYTTLEPLLLCVGPAVASARTWLTSFPVQVPHPSVSKLGLRAVNAPPVRGPRHTRHVPTSIALVEPESRM